MSKKKMNARMLFNNDIGDEKERLYNIKRYYSLKELINLLGVLKKNANYAKYFENDSSIKGYDSLIKEKMFPYSYPEYEISADNLKRYNYIELKFLCALVCANKDIINSFIITRRKFEHNFMKSDFIEAKKVLEKFENDYGYTFWGIEAKMALYNIGGLNSSFEYYNSISSSSNDPFIPFYLEILRDKMSLDINQRLFDERLNNAIALKKNDTDSIYQKCLVEYVLFSCYQTKCLSVDRLRNLLVAASVLTVVDQYILIERLFAKLVSQFLIDKNREELKILSACSKIFEDYVSLPMWKNINLMLGTTSKIEINDRKRVVHEALHLFCQEKLIDCKEYCINALEKYANEFSLINIISKINQFSFPKKQYEYLANFLHTIYKKESNDKQFHDIGNTSDIYERFYAFFTFGYELVAIIENELESDSPILKPMFISSMIMYDFIPSKLVFLMPPQKRKSFIDEFKKQLGNLYFCDWQLITCVDIIDDYIENFECDEISQKLQNITKKNDLQHIQSTHENPIIASFAIKRLFKHYVDEGMIREAVRIYTEAFFTSKWIVCKINDKILNKKINFNITHSLGSNLHYCVYLSITRYNLHYPEKVSEAVISCYKYIMKENKELYPSKLKWPEADIDKKCFAYFLRFICIDSTLNRVSPPFELQQDIIEERANILLKLMNYYKEVNDNESFSVLKKEYEALKIETETANVINWINNAKIDVSWILIMEKTDDAIFLAYNRCFQDKKDNEKDDEKYFEFLSGLAACKKNYVDEVNRILSLCIRHGVLENQIVFFFKKNGIDKEQFREYDEINNFYKEIYHIINNVIDRFVWVTDKKRKNEEMSLYIEDDKARTTYLSCVQSIALPEELKEHYLSILEEKLKEELDRTSELVYEELYQKLFISVDKLCQNNAKPYYTQGIICRDLLIQEINTIKQWFRVIENTTNQ